MTEEIVRVLRIVEYVGPRKWVEETVARSVQGEKRFSAPDRVIRAATIFEASGPAGQEFLAAMRGKVTDG